MSAELVPLSTHPAAALPAIGTPDVVNAWLRARNPNTLRGYLSDLNTFREWLGAPSTAAAVEALLSAGQAGANLMTMNYAAALVERGLAGATIARRLASLRSMCKVSRKIGRTNWSLDVEGPRVEARRDMRGPNLLDVRLLWLAAIGAGDDSRARRDRAIRLCDSRRTKTNGLFCPSVQRCAFCSERRNRHESMQLPRAPLSPCDSRPTGRWRHHFDEPRPDCRAPGSWGVAGLDRSTLHSVGEEKGTDPPSLSRRRSAAHPAPIVSGSIALRSQKTTHHRKTSRK
jgi:hypothetical protein